MKKLILSLVLVMILVLICPLAAACADSRDTHEGETTEDGGIPKDTSTTAEENSDYDEIGYLRDRLPEDLNFNGEAVNILYWSDVELPEFFTESVTGEVVNDAIYERNLKAEERIGVELKYIGQPGRNTALTEYTQKVGNSISAGDNEFDIMAAYSQTVANLTYNGYCSDLGVSLFVLYTISPFSSRPIAV
jgi:ABC-type glycerol-3-phosphate transport system substrate-binding protein